MGRRLLAPVAFALCGCDCPPISFPFSTTSRIARRMTLSSVVSGIFLAGEKFTRLTAWTLSPDGYVALPLLSGTLTISTQAVFALESGGDILLLVVTTRRYRQHSDGRTPTALPSAVVMRITARV